MEFETEGCSKGSYLIIFLLAEIGIAIGNLLKEVALRII